MSKAIQTDAFAATPIGILPTDWPWVRLQEIVPEFRKVTYGIVQPGAHDSQGVLLIRGQDYIKGWAEPDAFFRVARPLHDVFKRSLTVAGDLLICIVGATTGATNIVPSWISEANITQTTARVACDSRKADAHFVLYALASELGQMQVRKYIKGSAQPGLNLADVERFVVPAPPPPEQRKIARILTTVDNLIEKTESLIAKYQAIKQGMMHDLFTRGVDAHGHMRPSQTKAPDLYKQSELGWIPAVWEARTVGDVCETASGGTPSRDIPSFWNGDIPWVKTGEIKYCVIHDTEEKITAIGMRNSAARLLPKGTVVLALFGQGPTRGRVGILGIDATMNQACLALLASVAVGNEYLYFALVNAYNGIRSLSNDGAQQNLNSSLVRSFAIPVPDVSEQRHIVAILTSFDTSERRETDSLAKLRLQKTGLMQDLLTGKVRVKVDETEEVAHV